MLTITSAQFGHLDGVGAEEALADFRSTMFETIFSETADQHWTAIEERSSIVGSSRILVIEAYDQEHSRRVICKLVAAPPWMVQRSSMTGVARMCRHRSSILIR